MWPLMVLFVKEMVYLNAHYSVQYYGLRSVFVFYNNWTLEIKIKHRYNDTDSALMD